LSVEDFDLLLDAPVTLPIVTAARNKQEQTNRSGNPGDDRSRPTRVALTAEEKLKKDKCTLFVGNIPLSVQKRQFEAPFKGFGKILSSRFRSCPVNEKYHKKNKKFGVMKKDYIDGVDESKLRQNGYIVFAEPESVAKVMESSSLNNTDIFKCWGTIRLDYVVKPDTDSASKGAVKKFDRKKSIYIPHIPGTATETDVTAAVESADDSLRGSIKNIRIVKSEKSSFAFVLFAERAHATRAVKKAKVDFEFGSKKVEVRFLRIMKDEEIAADRKNKLEEFKNSAKIAAKKTLSRMKWQARLTRQGNAKVVSHHAMPRKERQEKMGAAALRIFRRQNKKKTA
jgi:RNA recognition motif-containing protein